MKNKNIMLEYICRTILKSKKLHIVRLITANYTH